MFGYVAVLLLMVLTISMLFTNGFGSNIRDRRITYPQLLTMIEEGQVRSVAIRGTSLVGVTTTTTVADADFPDKNYDFETTIGADSSSPRGKCRRRSLISRWTRCPSRICRSPSSTVSR